MGRLPSLITTWKVRYCTKKRLLRQSFLTNALGDTLPGIDVGRLPSVITTWKVRYSIKKRLLDVTTPFCLPHGLGNRPLEIIVVGRPPSLITTWKARYIQHEKNAYLRNLFITKQTFWWTKRGNSVAKAECLRRETGGHNQKTKQQHHTPRSCILRSMCKGHSKKSSGVEEVLDETYEIGNFFSAFV